MLRVQNGFVTAGNIAFSNCAHLTTSRHDHLPARHCYSGEMTFEEFNTILENEVKEDASADDEAAAATTSTDTADQPSTSQPPKGDTPSDVKRSPRVSQCYVYYW